MFSILTSVGNGVTTIFPITFAYIETNDVYVTVNDVVKAEGTDYTIENGSVVFLSPPSNGYVVKVFRQTDADALKVIWKRGGGFRESDLLLVHQQLLFLIQELKDGVYGIETGNIIPTPTPSSESPETLLDSLASFLAIHTSLEFP